MANSYLTRTHLVHQIEKNGLFLLGLKKVD